ncbi:MAG: HprK-related kinase A [Alphaproteobacteria bacterium]|nr:MAG: HprK-related kinase A [Alphaproteobacteria bacterium]
MDVHAFQVGAVAYRIEITGVPRMRDHLQRFYRDYPAPPGHVDHWLRFSPSRGWRRFMRRDVIADVPAPMPIIPLPARLAGVAFESFLNLATSSENDRFVFFHAASLMRAGRVLILPGVPGAGKSTLAAALMLDGWTLLSDEYALIDPHVRRLAPLPRPVSLKNESIAIIRERCHRQGDLGPVHRGTPKGDVAFLRAPSVAADARWPAGAVVFPEYRSGASARLVRLESVEALTRLLVSAMNFAAQGEAGMSALALLSNEVPVFALPYERLDDALTLLGELFSGMTCSSGGRG